MIGPNAVATAGHVVYDSERYDDSHWLTNISFYPAFNNGTLKRPYGSAKCIEARCSSNWVNNHDYSDDWGIIILDSNIGNQTGWLGLQWQSAPYSDTQVWVNGYPEMVNGISNRVLDGESVYCDQYIRSGTVTTTSEKNILESKNMFASKGDSGGPCYIYSQEYGYVVIGISSLVSTIDPDDKDGKDISRVCFRTIDSSLYEKFAELRTSTLK